MCRHFSEDFNLTTRVARFHNVYGPFGTYDGGREKAPAAIVDAEKEKLKNVKGRVIEKLLINAYLFYSRRQSKMVRSKTTFTVTPEQYYKDNRLLLRLWSWLGSTTHMVMLAFFSIINRLDLYLIFNITICNIFFVIILIMQKNVLKKYEVAK